MVVQMVGLLVARLDWMAGKLVVVMVVYLAALLVVLMVFQRVEMRVVV